MKKILFSLTLTVCAGAACWAADGDERWIHIHVDDTDGDSGRVDIQMPVGLVATLLPTLNAKHRNGTLHIQGDTVKLGEIRGYWNAVRSAKDGEYVTVRDGDSAVRVAKRDGFLRVNVDDHGDSSRVRIVLPLRLIDAVLADGDSVNFETLAKALAKAPHGDLVTVDDADSHVRIWIDSRPAAPREDGQ